MATQRLQLLRNTPIFGALSETALGFLLQDAQPVEVARGEYFFREGDAAQSLFVLEQGRVGIYKRWGNALYRLRCLDAGDCFGEMAVLDLLPRSASVRALRDCRALELTTGQLYALCKAQLAQYVILQMNIARELSRRLRAADQRAFSAAAQRGYLQPEQERPGACGKRARPRAVGLPEKPRETRCDTR
jgi:CRP-like cAMP-binding protein